MSRPPSRTPWRASAPKPADITREATLESLDIDSLDLAELSQIAEEKYGVALKSSDAERLKTVGNCVDLIVERAA